MSEIEKIYQCVFDKYITSDHIKNKNYNYYRLNKSKQTVLDIFDAWKSSNPMISVGGYTHQFMDKVKGYTGHINLGTKHFNYGV